VACWSEIVKTPASKRSSKSCLKTLRKCFLCLRASYFNDLTVHIPFESFRLRMLFPAMLFDSWFLVSYIIALGSLISCVVSVFFWICDAGMLRELIRWAGEIGSAGNHFVHSTSNGRSYKIYILHFTRPRLPLRSIPLRS
jgi:hypothetical protein